jgi:hypothetical protein
MAIFMLKIESDNILTISQRRISLDDYDATSDQHGALKKLYTNPTEQGVDILHIRRYLYIFRASFLEESFL